MTIEGALKESVAVFCISSDAISFSSGVGNKVSKNARLAGHQAAREALSNSSKDKMKQVFLMFSDGLSGNGADILRGAQEALGTGFRIIGGSASDELGFRETYQYINNNVLTNSVVGLLITGNIYLETGTADGWRPIGKPHTITKAKSNIIKEIDKRAAVEIYEEYFGKSLEELKNIGIGKLGISYPLGIKMKEKDKFLMRAPLKVEDKGSLFLSADIPEGEIVSLMIGDKNLALKTTKGVCIEIASAIQKQRVKFIMVFSDIGRYLLLRQDAYKEIEIIKEIFGDNIPIIGCYTYGGYASFHNQGLSITAFSE
jgi:hypothetical protein